MISINLFYCYEKFFPHMNTWIIRKNSVKRHCLKKKILQAPKYGKFTDADSTHAEKVCKDFKIKHIEKYYDLHIQSDTLLLADVFDSFRSMCLEIYELDTFLFLASPGLA